MSSKTILILFSFCALIISGCNKSQRATNANSPAANGNAANSTPAANAEKIGIPECDEFVRKYETCISDHVPEEKQKEYRENIEGWSKAFRQLVANRAAPEVIAAACKRHIVQARESMKSYGCEF